MKIVQACKMTFTWLREWDGDLMRMPSQRFRPFQIQKIGYFIVEAQAYLRWRHSDPWTAAIIPEALEEYRFWVKFPGEFPRYKHDQYRAAQNWLAIWIEQNVRIVIAEIASASQYRADDFRERVFQGLCMEPVSGRTRITKHGTRK